MPKEQLDERLVSLATNRCQVRHPEIVPPCEQCLADMRVEYSNKRAKAYGPELSPEESVDLRKRLGIP